jgi:peptidase M48-like protein
MRNLNLKTLPVVLALGAMPLAAFAQQPTALSKVEIVDKVVAQEQAEVRSLRQYSPLVETYIQNLRPDKQQGQVLDTDKYFFGRAHLAKGVELEPLIHSASNKRKIFGGLENFFSTEYDPRGFLQMIFLDVNGFDRQHYNFDYIHREFLGEVRCLVFDVDPLEKREKGRFVGRIWVEDQDYHIVRFNGNYNGSSKSSYYFNFDSWRQNSGKNQWLPAFIYSEEGSGQNVPTKNLAPQAFRAQTRLWGYALGHAQEEQELSKILVETPVKDQAEAANDYSPLQAQRSWSRLAEDNVTISLERLGVMAPRGEVDKVLETVVNNLEVTNNLDIQPEVRCRVLMISTLESFTMGHTIVVSRGLVDVLPDEGSLAAVLAHELGHVILGHRMDTQFAFFSRLRFDERETFRHFGFARTPEEEQAANQKGVELLMQSPYKDQSRTAQLFLQALQNRSKEIPNLISPHLGDRVPTNWAISAAMPVAQPTATKPAANVVALPLGGRIKVEPWSDQLELLKSKPVGDVAEYEKMPFEVTPFALYLTRQRDNPLTEAPSAASAQPDTDAKP